MALTPGLDKIVNPEMIAPKRRVGRRMFDFSRQVAVIAVIENFSSSLQREQRDAVLGQAIEACEKAIAAKVDWIEVRGVPFGPGVKVSEDEELDHLIPVIQACRRRTDAVISVDTFRGNVAQGALQAGADAISDSSGLHDPGLASIVANEKAGLIIAHSLAEPQTPVYRPSYRNIASEVSEFLRQRAALAVSHGVKPDKIFVDPGHDLHKNTYHSLQLTGRLEEITSIGYPTVVSVSHKPFLEETLAQPQDDRTEAIIATLVVCILQGARLVRIHDVSPVISAIHTTEAILGWRQPAAPRHNLV